MYQQAPAADPGPVPERLAPVKPAPRQSLPLQVLPDLSHFVALIGRELPGCRRLGTRPAVLLVVLDSQPAAALLEAVGARLRARVRASDLVVQLGEEGFGVLLLGAARADVPAVQTRLQRALNGPYALDEGLQNVRLRIGAAAHPEGVVSAAELVRAAGQALAR
jgi:predicted signal transduction protein with EAL and GGDEF domain